MDQKIGQSIDERITALEHENARLLSVHLELRQTYAQSIRRMKASAASFVLVSGVLLTLGPGRTAIAQGYSSEITAIESRITNLQQLDDTIQKRQAGHELAIDSLNASAVSLSQDETSIRTEQAAHDLSINGLTTKTKFMVTGFVGGRPATVFQACNVYIQDGEGHTAPRSTPNGLGNLIIGYDEGVAGQYPANFGCHNLILGVDNSYSSYGGIVAGTDNSIEAPSASVLGGVGNDNTGNNCVIVSGQSNKINGQSSAILSGVRNLITSEESAVIAGESNIVTGAYGCVVGGKQNVVLGSWATVSSGLANGAMQAYSWVGSGNNNHTEGVGASVVGGAANVAQGDYSSVSGGSTNTAIGADSTVSGGLSVVNAFPFGWSARGFLIP